MTRVLLASLVVVAGCLGGPGMEVGEGEAALERDPTRPTKEVRVAVAELDAPIGRTTSFRMEGRLYERDVRLQIRAERATRHMPTIQMRRAERGGHWVDVTVSDRVEEGRYWVEVRDHHDRLIAAPALLRAVRRVFQSREELFVAPTFDNLFVTDDGTILSPPPVQVTGHTPESPAQVGETLTLAGANLPFGSDSVWASLGYLDVYLDGQLLEYVERDGEHVVVRLPDSPVEGRLEAHIYDANTGYTTELLLDADFEVVWAPAFESFDALSGPGDAEEWKEAYLLSIASWLAYQEIPEVATIAPEWGLTFHQDRVINAVPWFGAFGSTQAYIFTTDDAVIVSFEGTQMDLNPLDGSFDNADIPTDLDMEMKELPELCPMKCVFGVCAPVCVLTTPAVHEGFWEATIIAYAEVREHVEALAEGRRVWVTGHSLGGAVAQLTALELTRDGLPVQGVYAFGAPVIGNAAFGTAFDERVANAHRFAIEDDVIPTALPWPYAGTGSLHRLKVDGSVEMYVDESLHIPTAEEVVGALPNPFEWYDVFFNPGGAHMSYWCRIYNELGTYTEWDEQLPPPPSFGSPMCTL